MERVRALSRVSQRTRPGGRRGAGTHRVGIKPKYILTGPGACPCSARRISVDSAPHGIPRSISHTHRAFPTRVPAAVECFLVKHSLELRRPPLLVMLNEMGALTAPGPSRDQLAPP